MPERDPQVQRAFGAAMGDVHGAGLLAPPGSVSQMRLPGNGRDRVLNSGTVHSKPTRFDRLSTTPAVWRNALANMPGAPPVQG